MAATKKRYSATAKKKLCEQWHNSNVSQRGFSQQHNISVQTFNTWLKRFGYLTKESKQKITLLPVKLSAPVKTENAMTLEIILQNGIRFRINPISELKSLFNLAQEFRRCK